MSKKIMQPIGQKRLTNVAVVRLKKHGNRFEIACYPNKVLSWRSGVEKDLDEVLQSQTVYSNVSKGILANSVDLQRAFGTDDHSEICLEILDKGELQVAGKERESQYSSQFRDIATIVMQKTINPVTRRPYTISMIERLMHDIHFAVDPHSNSKKQALDVIRELQKHYPIKRSPMRVRITVNDQSIPSLLENLDSWKAEIVSKDESGNQLSVICEMDPGLYRECGAVVRNLQGRMELLAVSVHFEGDVHLDEYDDNEKSILPTESTHSHTQLSEKLCDIQSGLAFETNDSVKQLSERMQKQTISEEKKSEPETKQNKCSTCSAVVGDAKQYRDHFKSDWHKHNLRRKTKQLPPLTAEECLADVDLEDSKADLKEYSF